MRKLVVMVLLGAVLEGAWLFGGLELLRGKSGPGPAGRLMQEVNQVKTLVGKAREVLDQASLGGDTAAGLSQGDPSRNPFALPQGVRLLSALPETADPKAQDQAGAPTEKDPAKAEPLTRVLSGILTGSRQRLAIIDGTLVGTGDHIEGEQVVDIGRDSVVLARDGQRRTLRLPPPFPESGQEKDQQATGPAADGAKPKRGDGAKP